MFQFTHPHAEYVTWGSMMGVRALLLLLVVPWVRKQSHVCSRLASTKRPRITTSHRRQPMPWEITCLSPESQRTESKSTSAAHDLTVRGSFTLTHRKAPWPTKPIRVPNQATTNRRCWRAGRKRRRRRRRWCCRRRRRRRRSRCRGTVVEAGAFGACGIFTTKSLRITTNWSPKSKAKAILVLSNNRLNPRVHKVEVWNSLTTFMIKGLFFFLLIVYRSWFILLYFGWLFNGMDWLFCSWHSFFFLRDLWGSVCRDQSIWDNCDKYVVLAMYQ